MQHWRLPSQRMLPCCCAGGAGQADSSLQLHQAMRTFAAVLSGNGITDANVE